MKRLPPSSLSIQDTAFPIDALPPTIRQLVVEAARALPAPIEAIALPAIASAGAAIGAKRTVLVKPGWLERPSVYTAILMPTGQRKSASLQAATKPVKVVQDDLIETYKEELAQYKQSKKHNSGGDTDEELEEPILLRTYTVDTTVERLGDLLNENHHGILILRDELTALVRSFNMYRTGGKGADLEFYLSVWSGAAHIIDRKGKEPICLSNPFLSIVGALPPAQLHCLIDGGNLEDGFLQRFLFAMPDPIQVQWTEECIAPEVTAAYQKLFDNLYNLNWSNGQAEVLVLSDDAKLTFAGWYSNHHACLADDSVNPVLKGFYSKLDGYCVRLALIHALCVDPNASSVGVGSVEAAITMTEYFKCQAEKVCALLAQPKKTPLERCEREILRNLSHDRILTKRELQQGGNAKATAFKAVFDQLVDSGVIVETQKAGRKRQVRAYQLANQG